MSEREEFTKESLQKSVKLIGELYPILENQDGKILDGNHRAESNPKYHRKTVQTKNRIEEILVRLHAHHRRRVTQEETKGLVAELAGELVMQGVPKTEVSVKLAELLPYTPGYVRELLSEEYKEPEKVEAGKVSAQITTQKRTELGYCEGCKTNRSGVSPWHGRLNLCPDCKKEADVNPEKFEHIASVKNGDAQILAKKQIQEPVKLTPSAVSKWEDRLGHMQVQHSKKELAFVKLCQQDPTLTPVLTDHAFPVLETVPDAFFVRHNAVAYVDDPETHGPKQMDRDDQLRELFKKHNPGWKVFVFREGKPEDWVKQVKDAV